MTPSESDKPWENWKPEETAWDKQDTTYRRDNEDPNSELKDPITSFQVVSVIIRDYVKAKVKVYQFPIRFLARDNNGDHHAFRDASIGASQVYRNKEVAKRWLDGKIQKGYLYIPVFPQVIDPRKQGAFADSTNDFYIADCLGEKLERKVYLAPYEEF